MLCQALDQLQALPWLPDQVARAVYDGVRKAGGR